MLDNSWRPARLAELEGKWQGVKLPTNESISAAQAERLMVLFLEVRDDWLDAYVNATYYEDVCTWKHETAYNVAFIKAEAKSDKSRDIIAKSDPKVMGAKLAVLEAHAAVINTKLKMEGAQLAHHAAKSIFNEASQERKYL